MIVTDKIKDAVHCKIIINLANAVTALAGYGIHPLSDDKDAFQSLMTKTIWEGVEISKAEGIKECKLVGIPSWSTIKQGATLPEFKTRRLFRKSMEKTQISSMTQDVLQRKLGLSELETLNGHILQLADKHGFDAPFNSTIYELCKNRFTADFTPMDVKEILHEVKTLMK